MPVDPLLSALFDRMERVEEALSRIRERMATYEAWHDNQLTQSSRSAAWLIAALSAAVGVVGILINIWLNGLRP